jgi:hypothetical protein
VCVYNNALILTGGTRSNGNDHLNDTWRYDLGEFARRLSSEFARLTAANSKLGRDADMDAACLREHTRAPFRPCRFRYRCVSRVCASIARVLMLLVVLDQTLYVYGGHFGDGGYEWSRDFLTLNLGELRLEHR